MFAAHEAYTVRITGKKSVAVGIQDFEALRRDQMFYVDKTDFYSAVVGNLARRLR